MMKMKLQRILAFGLVTTMALSLAACGRETDTGADSNKTEEHVESKAEGTADTSEEAEITYSIYDKEEKPITVTVGNLTAYVEQPNGDTIYDNLFKDFFSNALNIDYEFEIEGADNDDYNTALSLAITGGDLPDVIQVRDLSMLKELVEEGMVMDVTELYGKYTTDYIKTMYASVDYDHFAIVTFDDAIYAVPRANSSMANVVWLRQDWMDKLELAVDEDGNGLITLDEIKMLAAEFVAKDPGNSGNPVGIVAIDGGGSGYNYNSNLVNSAFGADVGYWYKSEDGSYVNGATVPGMKDALAWWAEMYAEGLLDPQYGITKVDDLKSMIANNQTGITFGGYNNPTWVWNDAYALSDDADWVAYGLDNGDGVTSNALANGQGRYLCISSACENPDAAMKLILWDMTIQVATAYAGGVEEALPEELLEKIKSEYTEFYESYLVDAAPCTFKRINPIQFSTYNQTKNRIYYDDVLAYEAGTLSKDRVSENALAYIEGMEHIKEGTATAAERMKDDELDGARARFNIEDNGLVEWNNVPVQIATDVTVTYESDLQTMVAETMIKIITGEEPIDYFDTFVEKYYQSGGEEIANEYAAYYE